MVIAIATGTVVYLGIYIYLRHRRFWDAAPSLITLYFCISALRSQWINLFPRVFTVTPEGLHFQVGAFPFRRQWLARWEEAKLLRTDLQLQLAGVESRFSRTVTIESHLSDTSRDMLITQLKSLCQAHDIELPSEEVRLSLFEVEDTPHTAGGTDPSKFWKG